MDKGTIAVISKYFKLREQTSTRKTIATKKVKSETNVATICIQICGNQGFLISWYNIKIEKQILELINLHALK